MTILSQFELDRLTCKRFKPIAHVSTSWQYRVMYDDGLFFCYTNDRDKAVRLAAMICGVSQQQAFGEWHLLTKENA